MAGFLSRGTMKPPLGAHVDPDHLLSRGFREGLLMNEGVGPPAIKVTHVQGALLVNGTTHAWGSNPHGLAYQFASTSHYLRLYTLGQGVLPTDALTVCVVRRKTDTTLRDAGLFGQESGSTTARRCGASAPNADGIIYWDFGGSTSPNRLTASGLSFTTAVETYIFTAGPQGSAIWQNGVKVASQSTPITRTTGGSPNCLNRGIESGVTTGDLQEINFYQWNNVQWSDELCRWWSAEPYAHLYPQPAQRRYFLLGDLAPVAGHPTHYYAQQRQQAT